MKNFLFFPFVFFIKIAYTAQEYIEFNNGFITLNYTNCGARTHFVLTALIENGVSIDSSWLGMTLSPDLSTVRL